MLMGMAISHFINALDFSNLLARLANLVELRSASSTIVCVSRTARYSNLFTALNLLISTSVFVLTWLLGIMSIIEGRWTAGGLSIGGEPKKKGKKAGFKLRTRFPSESLG